MKELFAGFYNDFSSGIVSGSCAGHKLVAISRRLPAESQLIGEA
jgi:hypothetical protein